MPAREQCKRDDQAADHWGRDVESRKQRQPSPDGVASEQAQATGCQCLDRIECQHASSSGTSGLRRGAIHRTRLLILPQVEKLGAMNCAPTLYPQRMTCTLPRPFLLRGSLAAVLVFVVLSQTTTVMLPHGSRSRTPWPTAFTFSTPSAGRLPGSISTVSGRY